MKLVKTMLVMILSVLLWGCAGNKENEITPTITPVPTEGADTGDTTQKNEIEDSNTVLLEKINYFDNQAQIDEALQAELENGYSFEDPFIIVNPYGNSPLTAVAIFDTEAKIGGTITVKGKSPEDDVIGSFPAETNHIVPVYGLYPDDTTQVELTLEDGTAVTFEVAADAIELSTEEFEAEMYNEEDYDYSDLTFICGLNGYIYAVDSKGDMRWCFTQGGPLGVKVLSNGHLAVPASYTLKTYYYKSGIIEMDLLGKIYHEYAIRGGMHHDIFELSDGNLLIASDRPDMTTVEDYIVEIDRETGAIVWELDMAELIHPEEGGSINRTEEDWFHNNGIWYEESTDTLLLSARHVDAIAAVDKSDKTLKWILGDPEGWSEEYQKYFFTPQGEEFEWQYAQHQVTVLSNGDIMCFDNGAGRTKSTKPEEEVTGDEVYSRAVVYRIDEENMTIEQIWQYGKEQGEEYYSEWVSGALSLDENPDNIWITFGSNLYNPEEDSYDYGPKDKFKEGMVQATNIVQVLNREPVYKLKLNHLTYRTLRLAAYEEAGIYDKSAQGDYLGNLGVTETVDAGIAIPEAVQMWQNGDINLDPIKLTLSASYDSDSANDLKDSYIVLEGENGTLLTYETAHSSSEKDEGITVTVTGWVSTTGLEGEAYNIYVVLGGTVYNTGYRAEL